MGVGEIDMVGGEAELAEMVGLNQAQVHRCEKGAVEPSM
jgi:predicted transcriptional regulator